MKKTFIERLWEKEPKLVKTKVASICTFREDEARFFTMIGTAKLNGNIGIVFREKGMGRAKDIFVGDFEIKYLTDDEFNSEDKTAEWLKFMHDIFGEEYVILTTIRGFLKGIETKVVVYGENNVRKNMKTTSLFCTIRGRQK